MSGGWFQHEMITRCFLIQVVFLPVEGNSLLYIPCKFYRWTVTLAFHYIVLFN